MDILASQMTAITRRVLSFAHLNFAVRHPVVICRFRQRTVCTTASRCQEVSEPFTGEVDSAAGPTLVRPPLPIITSRKLQYPHPYVKPKQAWLESLSTVEGEKLGLVDLHPEIFSVNPRIDMLHKNIQWQRTYKRISYAKALSRAEVRGGGRKPWRQKGMNRARHGSIRSPLWRKGGKSFGPRGPRSFFYMLPISERVYGLTVALSVKYAQNDLHIVDNLDIPTDDPEFMNSLMDTRFWGYSALFVDDTDYMPRNIAVALSKIPEFNLMPVYGLNVYSMLKHETLILTLAAVEKIEEKLLYQMNRTEMEKKFRSPRGHASQYKLPEWID